MLTLRLNLVSSFIKCLPIADLPLEETESNNINQIY